MIRSVEIKNLRGIQDGKLDDLTPLTVLVGPNGSGKSTILDALLIGTSNQPSSAVKQVAGRRSGVSDSARWLFRRFDTQEAVHIQIKTHSGDSRHVSLSVDTSSTEAETQLRIDIENRVGRVNQHASALTTFSGNGITSGGLLSEGNFVPMSNIPAVLVIEARENATVPSSPLYQLFTKTVEQGRKDDVLALMASALPELKDLQILVDRNNPIVYLVFSAYAVPVALAGDGVSTLFRQCLELAAASGGVALLEEPEAHEHPRAIGLTAKAIWAAVRRGIQVILTTHSLELIDSLLAEVRDGEELEKMSVYGLLLKDGCLRTSRTAGSDIAFARGTIEDDLR